MAIPFALGGTSELFVNVPAFGIAYSRAPKNMRGLVSALNLFNNAIAYAIGLATAGVVKDPYLVWDFAAPTIIGIVAAVVFYWMYHDIDDEEYRLSRNEAIYHVEESEVDEKGSEQDGKRVREEARMKEIS